MRIIKAVALAAVLGCIVGTVPVWAIKVTPSNVVLPAAAGELFSFDLIIDSSNPTGVDAVGFQGTIGVSPPGGLTFGADNSEAVSSNPGYWIYDNPGDAVAENLGGNKYRFSDGPYDSPESLSFGDTVARFAFTWDGVVTNYTFTLDLDPNQSYFRLSNLVDKEPLQFNPGDFPSTGGNFYVTIPEPATMVLLGMGSLVFLRKRKA